MRFRFEEEESGSMIANIHFGDSSLKGDSFGYLSLVTLMANGPFGNALIDRIVLY